MKMDKILSLSLLPLLFITSPALAHAQQFPILPPSNSTNLAPLSNLSVTNQSGQSLVESFGSPQALMQAVIDEAQKPGKVDKLIEECDLLETDKTTEESKEQVECTNRIAQEP